VADRLKVKARIKRASRVARDNAGQLDEQALSEIKDIYGRGLQSIQARIEQYGDDQGRLRLSILQRLKNELEATHAEMERLQTTALFERMRQVAKLGVDPFAERLVAERMATMVSGSVKAARDFIAADGLQLSDRLWRVNDGARAVVSQAVQSAVIQGESASRAAMDFLQRGEMVPKDIASKIGRANVSAVNRTVGTELMTGEGNPYHNARRLFRTEINRAHGMAYQAAAFEGDDVAGTRFLLSPNHPETDICDMHAKANLHGLGAGVYPQGKSPWPAHPNTLSYEEVVFWDEISDDDRKGKQSRFDWISKQPPAGQIAALGGVKKYQVFRQGVLRERELSTPWKVLKKRYERKGIHITG